MNSQKIAIALISLSGAAFSAGCGNSAASNVEPEAAPVAQIPVSTAQAMRGDILARYSATSALEAHDEAPVVAKVEGELIELLVEEGDQVTAGQILARLDGQRMKLAMNQAGAELRKMQQEYERNEKLVGLGLISEGNYENLRFEVEALQAAYELARINYGYSEIRSPIDGVISERYVKKGNHVTVNMPLFHITDSSLLTLELYVPQQDMSRFAVGQAAELHADAIPDREFKAMVERISPSIDKKTGTVRVTLFVDGNDGLLRPGMFTRVSVVYDVHNDAIMVPLDAVIGEDATSSVFVVVDGVAKHRKIETGITDKNMIEVIEGVNAEDKVVVIGQTGLRDGTPVLDHAG